MNTRPYGVVGAVAVLITSLSVPSASAALVPVKNVSAAPNTFECFLTASHKTVTIGNSTNVHAMVYKDVAPGAPVPASPGITIPIIKVNVGDTIICHFANNLSGGENASIHWHGIELDNDSDGTAVTQDALRPGQNYVYQFKTSRPGLFWFHSHMTPGDATFAGMYGALIVANTNEQALINNGTLPANNFTYSLAMSDIQFNPANGFVGKFLESPNHTNWYTINELVELCHNFTSTGNTNSGDNAACGVAGKPGTNVLVNGDAPSLIATNLTLFDVPNGKRIRLHLMNEAIARNFRLTLLYPPGNNGDTNLYRIGGQGGLLNNVRLEGGVRGTWDTRYGLGEIVIGSGDRADVLIYPTGTNGEIIRLVGNPLPSPFNLSGSTINPGDQPNLPDNYPVVYFRITNSGPAIDPVILSNAPILPGPIENLKTNTNLQILTDPASIGRVGTTNRVILLANGTPFAFSNNNPNVDGFASALEGNTGNGTFQLLTNPPTARYARVGDLLEFSVRNETSQNAVHPFHWHGFSIQPVRILVNTNNSTLYNYNYSEFLDTIDVYGGQTLVFRVKLEDRLKICDLSPSFPPGPVLPPCTSTADGGAIGRWLFHCHIFLHAGLGMMGELVVVSTNPPPQQTNWLQQPNLTTNGLDVLATSWTGSKTVADDFRSTNTSYVTGINIWGSWTNDLVDPSTTFELKFWTDVPATNSVPSRPGWQMWRQLFAPGTYAASLVASNILYEQFFDPSLTNVIATDTKVYRYDFSIPQNQAFLQQSNKIYWLSVTAYTTNDTYKFGWKTCPTNNNFNDAATWSGTFLGPHWTAIYYPSGHPYQGTNMNMSFQLTTPAPGFSLPFAVPAQPPTLSATTSDGNITIAWQGAGTLQYADDVTGPWNDVEDPINPYPVTMDQPQRFYRVQLPSDQ